MGTGSEMSAYQAVPEPKLIFAGGRSDLHPLRGLIANGPYSLDLGVPSRVRLAYLAPRRNLPLLDRITAELGQKQKPIEATNYYPEYPGFEQLFHCLLVVPPASLKIALPDDLDAYAHAGDKRQLAKNLFDIIGKAGQLKRQFDVLLLYLPTAWSACFEGQGFHLHDYLKAYCAPIGIPIQIVLEGAMTRRCRANVM